jgi:hypothetical protein
MYKKTVPWQAFAVHYRSFSKSSIYGSLFAIIKFCYIYAIQMSATRGNSWVSDPGSNYS